MNYEIRRGRNGGFAAGFEPGHVAGAAIGLCKQAFTLLYPGVVHVSPGGYRQRLKVKANVVETAWNHFGPVISGTSPLAATFACRRHVQALHLHAWTVLLRKKLRRRADIAEKRRCSLLTQVGLVCFPAEAAEHGLAVFIIPHVVRSAGHTELLLFCGDGAYDFLGHRFE